MASQVSNYGVTTSNSALRINDLETIQRAIYLSNSKEETKTRLTATGSLYHFIFTYNRPPIPTRQRHLIENERWREKKTNANNEMRLYAPFYDVSFLIL